MSGRRTGFSDDPDAPLPDHLFPGVSVAVVDDAGRLLMIRRPDDTWAVPAGAQVAGETVKQAGCREVRERTGVTCEIDALLTIFSNPLDVALFTGDGEPRQEFSILFRARPTGGAATAGPGSPEVAWCDRGTLLGRPMTAGQRRRVRCVLDYDGTPFAG